MESEFEPEVMIDERGCCQFRSNEKEDAKRAGLRISAHLPAHQADDGL